VDEERRPVGAGVRPGGVLNAMPAPLEIEAAVAWLGSEHRYLALPESIAAVTLAESYVAVSIKGGRTYVGDDASAGRFRRMMADLGSPPVDHRALLVRFLRALGDSEHDGHDSELEASVLNPGWRPTGLSDADLAELQRLASEVPR
jgi:hypothetical protein